MKHEILQYTGFQRPKQTETVPCLSFQATVVPCLQSSIIYCVDDQQNVEYKYLLRPCSGYCSSITFVMVKNLALALCIALVAAGPVAKRSTKTVTDDIADVGVKLGDLTKALEGYTGGVFAAVPVQRV